MALQYLDYGIAKLQGVHELDESREQEPVVLQKAVPFLALLFKLCRQGRVETTEPGCKDLCSEIQISPLPKFSLACNQQLPGDMPMPLVQRLRSKQRGIQIWQTPAS